MLQNRGGQEEEMRIFYFCRKLQGTQGGHWQGPKTSPTATHQKRDVLMCSPSIKQAIGKTPINRWETAFLPNPKPRQMCLLLVNCSPSHRRHLHRAPAPSSSEGTTGAPAAQKSSPIPALTGSG